MWELLGLLGLHGPFVAWVRDEGISECVYTCNLDDPFVGVDAAPTPPCVHRAATSRHTIQPRTLRVSGLGFRGLGV